jgi:hypothetical protein
VHLKSGLIIGVVSLEGSSLVVFYYLVASEIRYDKRTKLLPSRKTTPLIRPDFRCNETATYY